MSAGRTRYTIEYYIPGPLGYFLLRPLGLVAYTVQMDIPCWRRGEACCCLIESRDWSLIDAWRLSLSASFSGSRIRSPRRWRRSVKVARESSSGQWTEGAILSPLPCCCCLPPSFACMTNLTNSFVRRGMTKREAEELELEEETEPPACSQLTTTPVSLTLSSIVIVVPDGSSLSIRSVS